MLIITKKQMRAMDSAKTPGFAARLVQYVADNYPEVSDLLGEQRLTRLVSEEAKAASAYGLETGQEVATYLDMTLEHGTGFNTDPLLDGVLRLRNPPAGHAPGGSGGNALLAQTAQKAETLAMKMRKPDESFPADMFRALMNRSFDELEDELRETPPRAFPEFLQRIWPQKFERINADGVSAILEKAAQKAAAYGLPTREGHLYYALLMFLLGHDFDRDALYWWLHEVLTGKEYDDEYYKLNALHFTLQQFFETMLGEEVSPAMNS